MQIVSLSDFARRRAANTRPDNAAARFANPVQTDRWAMLHSPEAVADNSEPVEPADADFWGDLQFRLAYPTHTLRRH